MKVLIVPSWYPTEERPVSGIFFKEQAIALQKNGVEVTVAFPQINSLKTIVKKKEPKGIKFYLEQEVKTYVYSSYNYFPRIKGHIKWKYLNMLEKLIKQIIKTQGKPDVIHAHSTFWGGWASAKIARKYNIRLILTEHSSVFTQNLLSKEMRSSIKKTFEVADQIIAVGPSLKIELEKYTNKEIFVIPNIVDTKRFGTEVTIKSNDKFRFFSLALLTKNKGMDTLIKSFAHAFLNVENVELVIGGDGPEKENLIKLSEGLGISRKIEFTGVLDRIQVVKQMQNCEVFVLASRNETFGVVYIEALAAGKPIIGTKCGGPEMIVNEENGILVNIDEVQELSKAMNFMMDNFENFNSKNIMLDCEERFSEHAVSNMLKTIYYNEIYFDI